MLSCQVTDVKTHTSKAGKVFLRFHVLLGERQGAQWYTLVRLKGMRYQEGRLWAAQRRLPNGGEWWDHWDRLAPELEAFVVAELKTHPAFAQASG